MKLITDDFLIDASGNPTEVAAELGAFFSQEEVPSPVPSSICVFIPNKGKTAAYVLVGGDTFKKFSDFLFWNKINSFVGFHILDIDSLDIVHEKPLMIFFAGDNEECVGLGVGAEPKLLDEVIKKLMPEQSSRIPFDVLEEPNKSQAISSILAAQFTEEFNERVYKTNKRIVQ